MSHTPARSKQTDVEHIQIAAEHFEHTLVELKTALETSISDDAKVAFVALIEIAESGLRAARKCREQIERSQFASSTSH